jgi:nucleoside-diphosphate-sugar epimerase
MADRTTISAILDVFAETEKSFVYTSGIWILGATGTQVAREDWRINPIPRVAGREEIERRVLHAAEHGMRTCVIRPGIVYGRGKGILGMVCPGLDGVVRFVGDGENHWPVVELEDLARFYLLALEKAPAGSLFLAVSENVVVKDVAEALRAGYGARATESIPLETARAQMGEFADALVLDQQADSAHARGVLGWTPQAPPLLESLKTSPYAL